MVTMNPTANSKEAQPVPGPIDKQEKPTKAAEKTSKTTETGLQPVEQAPVGSEKAPVAMPPAQFTVPPLSIPVPPIPVSQSSTTAPVASQATDLSVVDDSDLIEKEWVNKAKEIVALTRDDPYKQSEELTVFKADYMKKRYDKHIKLSK